jgi:hypothetical protein
VDESAWGTRAVHARFRVCHVEIECAAPWPESARAAYTFEFSGRRGQPAGVQGWASFSYALELVATVDLKGLAMRGQFEAPDKSVG